MSPKTTPIRLKVNPGFSLIEVLLFLLIVLVLVTILLTSASNLSKTRQVNLESVASEIASCEIEQLRKTDFSLLPGNGSIGAPCNADLSKLPSAATATRTTSDYQSDPDVKQVVVLVGWTENGVARNVKIDTIISRYGL